MSDDVTLVRLIHHTIADARAAGLDHVGQRQQAVAAVLQVRPYMTASEAMALVERVWE